MHTQYVKHAVAVAVSVAVLVAVAWLCGCGSGLVGRDSAPAGGAGFQPAVQSADRTPAPQSQTPAPPQQETEQPGAAPQTPATPEPTGPFPIPTPGQIYERQHGKAGSSHGKAAAGAVLSLDGSGFEPGLAQRVGLSGLSATFDPAWENGFSPFETIAWAIYRFDLTGWSGRPVVHTEWDIKPHDYTRLWLGGSNWRMNRWEWASGAAAGGTELTARGGIALFKHPASSEMYVALVMLGESPAKLRRIWVTLASARGDWWMAGRDAGHASCSPFKGPDSPTLRWQRKLAQFSYPAVNMASPVYDADGTIYVATSDGADETTCQVYALYADGELKWMHQLTELTNPYAYRGLAIDDDGTIYYVQGEESLHALNADGAEEWDFAGHGFVSSDPAIGPDGTVYVLETEPDYSMNYLSALNKDGSLRWERHINFVSAPAVDTNGTVYVTYQDQLYAYNPDGSLRWYLRTGAGSATYITVGQEGTIYVVSRQDELFALCAANADGTPAWSRELPGIHVLARPTIGADGTIYVVDWTGALFALNADGTLRWSHSTGEGGFTAIGFNGAAVDAVGAVYVCGADSRLYAIDSVGELKWWFVTTAPIYAQPVIAEDGTIYVIDSQGMFYAIGPGSQLDEHSAVGYVKDQTGVGISGVTMTITGEEPVVTDANGRWSKGGLTDGAYLVSPTKAGCSFSPLLAEVQVGGGDVVVPDFVGSALAAPVWPMWGLDRAHTRRSPHIGPDTPNVAWSVDLGEGVNSEPMIGGDGTLYVQGAEGTLFALHPDGTERWRYAIGCSSQASPAIGSDGSVLTSAENGLLYALAPDGQFRFVCLVGPSCSGSPVVAQDGTIYQCSNYSWVHAFTPDGVLLWSDGSGSDTGASPALAPDGTLYIGTGSRWIYAFAASGLQAWEFPADAGLPTSERGAQSSAAVGADGTIYLGFGINFYAINPDGTQQWVYDTGQRLYSSPAIGADGTLYFGTSDKEAPELSRFLALNPGGTLKWEYPAGAPVLSSPAVDANGVIYVGLSSGALCAFNPDGSVKWSYAAQDAVNGNPSIGADGTLYFGDAAGYLYALGPGGG
jgi:outer membrane protein assembly factor BamB